MAKRYPGDGAVTNGSGRRHLHGSEACLLYEAEPDARRHAGAGLVKVGYGGVPVPPLPSGADRRANIARIQLLMSESSWNQPRYASDSNMLWTAYFERRHAEQLAATNGAEPHVRFNSEG
ncbi:Homeobox protein KNOX3 [Hordeum vulgare]|nr:Homeobox protein KNOX3 [Hordeum vulgare]